jgi:hypothetical protein
LKNHFYLVPKNKLWTIKYCRTLRYYLVLKHQLSCNILIFLWIRNIEFWSFQTIFKNELVMAWITFLIVGFILPQWTCCFNKNVTSMIDIENTQAQLFFHLRLSIKCFQNLAKKYKNLLHFCCNKFIKYKNK